jgi:hypothetical protein
MPRAWHLPVSDPVAGTQNRKMRATLSRRVFLERNGISASDMSTKNPRAERCLPAFTELHFVPALVSYCDVDWHHTALVICSPTEVSEINREV